MFPRDLLTGHGLAEIPLTPALSSSARERVTEGRVRGRFTEEGRGEGRFCFVLVAALLAGAVHGIQAGPSSLESTLTLPAKPPAPGESFAVLASGDGGWAELDRELARRLAAADIPVVGWNSRAYYWTRRTPEEASADLGRLITRFRAEWQRPKVLLVGFSRGADVLPFLTCRLPAEHRAAVRGVVLLGPAETVDFQFHLTDYVRDSTPATALPVPPEITRRRGTPLLVVYGEKDDSSCGAILSKDLGQIVCVPGDHHFNRDYDRLAQLILGLVRAPSGAADPRPEHKDPG